MKIGNMEVSIYAEPGIFILGSDSATGKSYLYGLLKAYLSITSNKGKVLIRTYDNNIKECDLISDILKFDGIFILLDRFDLYYSESIISALIKSNKPCLIDLKNGDLMKQFIHYWAEINLSVDKLVVKGYIPNIKR